MSNVSVTYSKTAEKFFSFIKPKPLAFLTSNLINNYVYSFRVFQVGACYVYKALNDATATAKKCYKWRHFQLRRLISFLTNSIKFERSLVRVSFPPELDIAFCLKSLVIFPYLTEIVSLDSVIIW